MPSTALLNFVFNDQSVRVLSINNEPWFVTKDVCAILTVSNVGDALSRLDDDEKGELSGESLIGLTDDLSVTRLSVISESGLYSMTLSSRKPQAKPFKRWVTREVLPAIRKNGKYEIDQKVSAPALPEDFEQALEALLVSVKEKKALALANQKLEQEKKALCLVISEAKPKADFYDIYVNADGWLTGEQIAKQLSVSNRKMFDILRAEKIVYQRANNGRNLPCQKWVDKGFATMREVRCTDNVMRFNLVFSHKAIMQIFDLLQDKGLIPKNRDYQLRFELEEPKEMKRA